MTDADLLEEVGAALYRGNWKMALADDLGVRMSSVQNWARGKNLVPAALWREIATLIATRCADLERVQSLVEEHRKERA